MRAAMTPETPARAAAGHSVTGTAGLVMLVLATGCAGLDRAQAPAPGPTDTQAAHAAPVGPQIVPAAAQPALPALRAAVQPARPATVAAMPEAPPAVARPAASPSPPSPPSSPLKARSVVKDAAQAQAPARPAPLDLKSLEERLKSTPVIGVFTKLTLKNQIDGLLAQFRAHYAGQGRITLGQLRQSYDRLLLKVLALLQDADPPLAQAIASSREAIWGVLSNPASFAAV